jgi:ATP-dependent helicase/nuclease subunit A
MDQPFVIPMNPLSHQAISAAAGSGKTFQLTNRYIALLARGCDPAHIVALTFSRKAAGEIFDKIVQRLAIAAGSQGECQALNQAMSQAGYLPANQHLDRTQLGALLRRMIESLHVARIGTLDSFFISIIKAFPFEFGLSGSFSIIEGYEAVLAKQDVLREVMRAGESLTSAQAEFLEAFKQATFGQEEKSLSRSLDTFIDSYHRLLLEAPEAELWGNPERIWPEGLPWRRATAPAQDAAAIRKFLETDALCASLKTGLGDFVEEASCFQPGHRMPDKVRNYFAKYLLAKLEDLSAGNAALTYRNKDYALPEDVARAVWSLCSHVIRCTLEAKLHTTQGTYRIVREYETRYEEHVRQSGRLSFMDVLYLLARGMRSNGIDSPVLSENPLAENRLYVDYRIDGRFNHWLLDEFQDTSTLQWLAISNLANEVLQAPPDERSFFYVGDVKQAIYGWRGGDSELFHALLRQYQGVIEPRPLYISWRSAPAIIETTNRVFDELAAAGTDLPDSVTAKWSENWTRHEAARRELPGYAALYEIPRAKNQAAQDVLNRYAATASILKDLRDRCGTATLPSVAVLVRSNQAGQDVVNVLRTAGLPAVWEGDFAIADNQATAALLSLVKLAEHPGDTFAWQHLQMTPFAAVFVQEGLTKADLCLRLLHDIHRHGFEYLLETWAVKAGLPLHAEPNATPDQRFTAKRLDDLLTAARQFDAGGNKNCVDFRQFILDYTTADAPVPGTVQVMTIHKSKGLEFDVVVLPELEGHRGITTSDTSGICLRKTRDIQRAPQWALEMPTRDIAQVDPNLLEHLEQLDTEGCYEQLCTLYVALTRAKQALYMVTTSPSLSSSTLYLSTLLRLRLGTQDQPDAVELAEMSVNRLFECGRRDWLELRPPQPASPAESTASSAEAPRPEEHPEHQRHPRRTPSGDEAQLADGALLFSRAGRRSRLHGSAVHNLLQEISWSDAPETPARIQAWRDSSGLPADIRDAAVAEVTACLARPDFRAALRQPPEPNVELWREKGFEIILDNQWVSGIFDRVVIFRAPDGQAQRAIIQDFKTDRFHGERTPEKAAERYRPQLALYQQALARMLALPPESIALQLLFSSAP